MSKKTIIILIIALIFLVDSCSGNDSDKTTENETNIKTEQQEVTMLCDVNKYANLSSSELIALLGKPDYAEKQTESNGFVNIPSVYYDYDNTEDLGEATFILVNDRVAQMISYKQFPYIDDREDLLKAFNVEMADTCSTVIKNDTSFRLRCPSEAIDDFYVTLIDTETETFEFLKVTYDMEYFEEWYLPMGVREQSDYQYYTQENVKSILKAPKTADFPSIRDWSFGKNPFYTAVQSYVDAQNSFGAEIRSEFYFVYQTGTDNLVYAIFDGEVIYNDGYVPTADLIKKLVTTTAPTKITKDNAETPKINNTQSNQGQANSTQTQSSTKFITKDMNQFLAHYILPQYVTVQGTLHDYVEYDSNESTDWCYKLVGKIGNDSYEAMVYPFCDYNNNVEDLWFRYLYWNGNLIIENDPSEQIYYTPKKYW